MTAFSDSVAEFHSAIRVVEAALQTPYDFERDRDKVVLRFQTAWNALKANAAPNATRDDVRAMLADNSNLYRTYASQIAEMRDPKQAARRRRAVTQMRRNANIEIVVVDEVAAFWERDAERRRKPSG
jgi:hypothetical protein